VKISNFKLYSYHVHSLVSVMMIFREKLLSGVGQWSPEQKHVGLRRKDQVVLPARCHLDAQFAHLLLTEQSFVGHLLVGLLCEGHVAILIGVIHILLTVGDLISVV